MRVSRKPCGMDIVIDPVRAEASLWRRFRFEHDQPCREGLFNRYIGLARTVAGRLFRQRATRRLERGDFDQFACEGLLQALDRYDPLTGVPFSAYARRRIAGSVADGIATMSEIDAQLGFRRRIEQDRLRSLAWDQADPLARLADLAVGIAIGLMLEGTGVIVETDAVDHRPDPYDTLAWRETEVLLAAAVGTLPGQEAVVVRQHYANGLPFAQVAQLMDLSRGRVSQLHHAALDRLRKKLWGRT